MDVPTLSSFLRPTLTLTSIWITGETGDIYSRLSRCSTARGSGTGSSLVGHTTLQNMNDQTTVNLLNIGLIHTLDPKCVLNKKKCYTKNDLPEPRPHRRLPR